MLICKFVWEMCSNRAAFLADRRQPWNADSAPLITELNWPAGGSHHSQLIELAIRVGTGGAANWRLSNREPVGWRTAAESAIARIGNRQNRTRSHWKQQESSEFEFTSFTEKTGQNFITHFVDEFLKLETNHHKAAKNSSVFATTLARRD